MSEVILGKHGGKNGIADRLDKIEDLVGKRGNGWEDIVKKLNDSNDANNRNWEDNKKKQKKIGSSTDFGGDFTHDRENPRHLCSLLIPCVPTGFMLAIR